MLIVSYVLFKTSIGQYNSNFVKYCMISLLSTDTPNNEAHIQCHRQGIRKLETSQIANDEQGNKKLCVT